MTPVVEDQTTPTSDDALLQEESATQCVEEAEKQPAEPTVHSEEVNQEEDEQGSTSSPTDVLQDGDSAERKPPAAPDGGWGWVVLVATMLVQCLTLAFSPSLGIFYTDLQRQFDASNAMTSWVPAIIMALMQAGGPLCSMLVERFGCRATVLLGGLLSGLAMAAASLARSLIHIYITGAITGLGFCLSLQTSVTIIGHYFVKHRVFANAMSSTGTALGLTGLPLINNALLSQFGWRGSFLILGGLLLNLCVCGAVMWPVASASNKPRNSQVVDKSLPKETKRLKDHVAGVLSSFGASLRQHTAFDLLVSNARYRAHTVGSACFILGYGMPFIFLVPYATQNNISRDRAAFLLFLMGLVNIAVRPTAALVLGMPRFRGSTAFVYVFTGAVCVNGLSNLICAASASFEALLVFVLVFGLSMSLVMALIFSVLMSIVELRRLPAALGFQFLMNSVVILIGPPIGGLLLDFTGQYSYVFYMSSLSSISGLYMTWHFYSLDKRDEEQKRRNMRTT